MIDSPAQPGSELPALSLVLLGRNQSEKKGKRRMSSIADFQAEQSDKFIAKCYGDYEHFSAQGMGRTPPQLL